MPCAMCDAVVIEADRPGIEVARVPAVGELRTTQSPGPRGEVRAPLLRIGAAAAGCAGLPVSGEFVAECPGQALVTDLAPGEGNDRGAHGARRAGSGDDGTGAGHHALTGVHITAGAVDDQIT